MTRLTPCHCWLDRRETDNFGSSICSQNLENWYYAAIQDWLATQLGIVAPYKTVHKWVYYRLQAAPKVVRPQSDKQNPAALEAYKKTS